MRKRNSGSFDHLAEEFDFWVSLERSSQFFLRNLPDRHDRVLDIGCGTGILALDLSRHFRSVTAVDISEPMLEIARRKRAAPNIDYQRLDANQLALAEKFDAIVSHTTFHHLKDIVATLEQLKAALEPGGRLILIDNVLRWGGLLRRPLVYRIASCVKYPVEVPRYGMVRGWRLLRFRLSSSWVEHVSTDRLLSEKDFREIYGRALPGASFHRTKYFMGVVWQSPSRIAR